MANTDDSKTNDLLLALAHPLRRHILRTLAGDKPRSPRELADTLGKPLSNLSYHVRVLADCGAVKLVRKQRVRGATQRFYRAAIEAEWARSVLEDTDRPKRRRGIKRRWEGRKKP